MSAPHPRDVVGPHIDKVRPDELARLVPVMGYEKAAETIYRIADLIVTKSGPPPAIKLPVRVP